MVLSTGLLVMLAGCATPEYLAAKDECTPGAYRSHPVVNVPGMIPRQRWVEIPTGQTKCTTKDREYSRETVCEDKVTGRFETYYVPGMVDSNAQARQAVIDACSRNLCVKRFGNPDCKKPK
jgi:hypothetical protein